MILIFEFVLGLHRVIKEIFRYRFCESVTYIVAEDVSRLPLSASQTRQCCFLAQREFYSYTFKPFLTFNSHTGCVRGNIFFYEVTFFVITFLIQPQAISVFNFQCVSTTQMILHCPFRPFLTINFPTDCVSGNIVL